MQGPGVCMHVLYVVVGLYRALKIVGECSANIHHTFAELVAINSERVHHTFTENYNSSPCKMSMHDECSANSR